MTELATRPPGRRPRLLESDTREAILTAIRDGAAVEHAVAAAGISTAAFYNWNRWGREETERRSDPAYTPDGNLDCYVQFMEDVSKARAEAMIRNARVITAATQGGQLVKRREITRGSTTEVIEEYQAPQWTAAAWMLERHAPALFGKREAHHLTSDPLPDRPVSEEERLAERVRAWAAENRVIEGEIAEPPLLDGT